MFNALDHVMMSRAIALAERGRGIATPNPHVGCVVVKAGRIIGEGFTQRGGRPHAEAMALQQAGAQADGATVYSTLEPCALHAHSRGPACAALLVAAKVKRIVSAIADPFAGVDGRGHAQLAHAGIQVHNGLMAAEVKQQLKAFLARVTRNRPWVTLKLAASLDGKTALANGQSKWITSAEARRDVHALRAKACAVMTGIGSALADDPALTVRDVPTLRQPLRVLLDSRLDVRDEMQLVIGGNTLVITATGSTAREDALKAQGIDVLRLPTEAIKGKVDLVVMMQNLAARKLNHILVETGAKLNGSLLAAGVVDEIILYTAPDILGEGARGLFALHELSALTQRYTLQITDTRMVGRDQRITANVIGKN